MRRISKRELLRRIVALEEQLSRPTPPPLAGQETIPDALFNTPHETHQNERKSVGTNEK